MRRAFPWIVFVLVVAGAAVVVGPGLLWTGNPQSPARDLPSIGPEVASEPPPAVLLGTSRAESGDDSPSRARGPVVHGLVYDVDSREPLPGVTVTWRGTEGTSEAETDERGIYRLRVSGAVQWYDRLHFAKAGYLANAIEGFNRRTRSRGRIQPVGLEPVRAHLPGRVVDYRGRPLAGVSVRVENVHPPYVSDAWGRFGPVAIGTGQVHWMAWGHEHPVTEDYWDLPLRLPSEVVAEMFPGGFVPGVVVNEEGEPVAGAEVHQQGHHDRLRIRTGNDGRFRWPQSMDIGSRLVAVAGDQAGGTWGRAGLPVRIVLEPMDPVGAWRWRFSPSYPPLPPPSCEVAARPKVRVRLLAADVHGHPLPWAGIRVERPGGFWQSEWTGRRGTCDLFVPSGLELDLKARHYRAGQIQEKVTFEEGRSHVHRMTLHPRPRQASRTYDRPNEPPATWIRGVVMDAEGHLYPGIWIHASPPWADGSSDERGRFELSGGRVGEEVRLRVTGAHFAPFTVRAVGGGSDMVIRLPARSAIQVRTSGTPDEGARPRVKIWATSWLEDDILPADSAYVLAQHNGFRIDCPVGVYTVAFRLEPGEWVLYPEVGVEAGRETTLTYAFPRSGHLEGWVHTAEGDPIPDAEITVARTGGHLAWTDAEGRIETYRGTDSKTPTGRYRLRVRAEGFAPALTRPVDLRKSEHLDVTLEPGVGVSGILLDAVGTPVKGRVGWLTDLGPPVYEVETEEDGTFELEGSLPPGPARLVVRVEGREPYVQTIDVSMGKTTRVRLQLP